MKANRGKFSLNAKMENTQQFTAKFLYRNQEAFSQIHFVPSAVERHLKISHGTFVSLHETFQNEHRSSAQEI
jgi:hypothetical protein